MERIRRGGAATLIALVMLGAAGSAQATILLFDETISFGSVRPTFGGASIPAEYGDRVTGTSMPVLNGAFTYGEDGEGFTPGVLVDITGGSATPGNPEAALWRDLYGDLTNVAFAREDAGSLNILLTGDPGVDVVLYGFELAGWPETDYVIAGLEITSSSATNPLFSQTDVNVLGDFDHTTFSFATALVGSEILIHIDVSNLAGEDHDAIGIDNLRFGQKILVPEPSTALLLAGGLTLLAAARRR